MPIRASAAVLAAMLDAIDAEFGEDSVLEIRTGSQPAAVTDAATGTLLVEETFDATAWSAASGGSKAYADLPAALTALAGGTAGWFRLKNLADDRRIDGVVTGPGGGGHMILDNPVLAVGQAVNITAFNLTMTGAS